MMALNAKLTNGSKCPIKKIWWHLNAKLTNGSECLTMNYDFEHQTVKMVALNSNRKNMMTLNAKLKTWL